MSHISYDPDSESEPVGATPSHPLENLGNQNADAQQSNAHQDAHPDIQASRPIDKSASDADEQNEAERVGEGGDEQKKIIVAEAEQSIETSIEGSNFEASVVEEERQSREESEEAIKDETKQESIEETKQEETKQEFREETKQEETKQEFREETKQESIEVRSAECDTERVKISPWVNIAIEREQAQFTDYSARLHDLVQRTMQWQDRSESLQQSLTEGLAECRQRLSDAKTKFEKLPEEVRIKLAGRQKVLDIVTRQLNRLDRSMNELNGVVKPLPELRRISSLEWTELLEDVSAIEEKIEERIKERLTVLEGEYWEILSIWRTIATESQKHFKDFVTAYVLSPMDGLFDGQPITYPIVEDLKVGYPAVSRQLSEWFNVYSDCSNILAEALMKGHVYRIPVSKGTPFDAEYQEPVDTESDPELEDDHIKEIFRIGYRVEDDGHIIDRIRRTQVIVVKN